MTISSLSVFDWSGPEFLGFYSIAFVLAVLWSLWLRNRANDRFALANAESMELNDPYELAFLAGGGVRCCQVVVVRLLKSGAVEWKKTRILRQSRLHATGPALAEFNDIERTVFSSIMGYGKKGMPLAEIPPLVATRISGIEAKLAKLGLRPTASEANGRGCITILPMLALMLVGFIKVMVGLSRDKPVGFLCIFLFASLVAVILLASKRKKLTPAGEKVLERMRSRVSGKHADPMMESLCGVALLGVPGIAYDESLVGMDDALRKEISQMGKTSSSGCGGDSGCSSGCSSGCGGGCGGCGGD